ncbi:class I SAM-dependent methyltransferase [Chitinimonas sp. BJYL2]|uniref:class I SAM-dependent methyltransferase n=1 Tax=Chitinimonas sp. BJYL2 TaxID=2976696 RepID=UPI0022B3F9A4|nr:class I SAM-dependent methyltransferase [Chitinimonas sp. BJYL2]
MVVSDEQRLENRLKAIEESVSDIQGWLLIGAGAVLYDIVLNHVGDNPVVVELGSWKGRSTCWLASAVQDRGNGHVWAVDTWQGSQNEDLHAELLRDYEPDQLFNEFKANLATRGLGQYVTPMRMTTHEAAKHWPLDRQVDVLFVDADHAYHAVRKDFELWSAYVKDGGFIVFDDVPSWPGPTRLVSELPSYYMHVMAPPNQWVVRKIDTPALVLG